MSARWWSFGVWALVAGSALFWGLRLFVKSPPAPAQAVVAELGGGARGDLTRLFGNDPPPPPSAAVEAEPQPVADARFQLIGVLSPRPAQAAGQGLALIAVDGKPARAYRVGAVVDGSTVLQSVRARGATLGPRGGAAQVALEIAPPVAAATGTLPDAGAPPATPAPSPGLTAAPTIQRLPSMPPGGSPNMSPGNPYRQGTPRPQAPAGLPAGTPGPTHDRTAAELR